MGLESKPWPLLKWHQLPDVHKWHNWHSLFLPCLPECQDEEATPELRSWARLHVKSEREQHEAGALEEVAWLCREHAEVPPTRRQRVV